MNVINKYFDKIYIITCKEDSNRHDLVFKQLQKFNIQNYQFIVSIEHERLIPNSNISTQEMSLIISHINCVFLSKLNKLNNICILEDDFLLLDDYEEKMDIFMKNLPYNWGYLHLGVPSWTYNFGEPESSTFNDYVKHLKFAPASHFIGLNSRCFDHILSTFTEFDMPVDHMYHKKIYSNNFFGYMPNESLCDAKSIPHEKYHSNIKNFNKDNYIESKIRQSTNDP